MFLPHDVSNYVSSGHRADHTDIQAEQRTFSVAANKHLTEIDIKQKVGKSEGGKNAESIRRKRRFIHD